MTHKQTRNYQNLQRWSDFQRTEYDFPVIEPTRHLPKVKEWIGFNYSTKQSRDGEATGVHFYLDDYQFERVWNDPDKYCSILQRYAVVASPDFSLFTDYPLPLQMYNHYRKHWLAAYMQSKGIIVIPTICWSDEYSFEWCFDGEPKDSWVTVSSTGALSGKTSKQLFLNGYEKMLKELSPKGVLFYGKVPEECREMSCKIKHIPSFSEVRFKRE